MGGSSTSSTGCAKPKAGAASLRTDAFTVSITKGMAEQAAQVAKAMGITKAQLVKNALAGLLEDLKDTETIKARRSEPSIPHDQFWKNVGLEG